MTELINDNQAEALIGSVQRITYCNQINGYTVAEVKTEKDIVTVVGVLPFLNEGDNAEFKGSFKVHPTYGQQFLAESFQKRMPQTAAAILKYLSAGAIKGVGPATAGRIVELFSEKALEVIQNEPLRLTEIRGISREKALHISEEYKKQYGIKDIMLMLSKYKVSPDKCLLIYKRFKDKATDIIKANPYTLCEEGIDFRFEVAEEIAADLDFKKDNEFRIAAGLEYILRKNLGNGHSCLPRDKFIRVAADLLECVESRAEIVCDRLIECFRISSLEMENKEFVALPNLVNSERYIASRLFSVNDYISDGQVIDRLEIEGIERSLGIEFEELQKKAIFEAFNSGILVLTGGPGTGKTTTLNAIIKLFEGRGYEIELAAPTGRAAKRMTELTGREAKTLHRLLEVEWGDGEKRRFARNEKNPLDCQVIIVDEASMIDSLLFEDLLKALKLSCRIILVGDSDQLPSIGAGNVLGDILSSEKFPSIALKKVFRQAKESKIIANAHAIINNEPANLTTKNSDFFFLNKYDRYSAVQTIVELIAERLPKAYNTNPLTQIQVLCPSRLGDTGTVNLNNLLQQALNPKKENSPEIYFKGFYLRVGDKVMQTKNNYDLQFLKGNGEYGTGIYNGDIGFITDIDSRAGIVKVRFEDRTATYFSEDLQELELAYAVTVHKSQGSEYDYCILPLCEVPQKLRYRNLLYTAITRAKRLLICVGNPKLWQEMADNDRKTLRYTMLKYFINKINCDENF